MESRKMVLMNLFVGQQWRHRHRKQTDGHGRREEGERGTNAESSVEAHTLPSVKQIAEGNFLSDSGNSNWGSVTS